MLEFIWAICILFNLFCVAECYMCPCSSSSKIVKNRFIIDGTITDPAAYDFTILPMSFKNDVGKKEICTATVIGEKYVLTSRHCTMNPENKKQYTDFEIGPETDWVVYASELQDIAILEASKNIFDEFVSLAFDDLRNIIKKAKILGYGNYHANPDMLDGLFREADVNVMSLSECPCNPFCYCTEGITPSIGVGDSGGPLGIFENDKFYQLGVISSKHKTAPFDFHVPVCHYCSWITDITKGAVKCEWIFNTQKIDTKK